MKENSPLSIPQEKGFRLAVSVTNDLFPFGMEMPARGDAAFRATIRFASAPTIRCRSAHLVEVQTNLLLPTMHTVSIMRTAASEAMPLRQAIPGLIESEVERSYVRVMNRRQSDSEDRSKSNRLDIKQGRHLIRQALQFFELLACNGGVKGQGPLRSLGGPRGIFSHVREYPPYPVQRHRRCHPHCAVRRKKKRGPRFRAALFLCRFSSRSRYCSHSRCCSHSHCCSRSHRRSRRRRRSG